MATTDQLVTRAKLILSRANDTNLDARIIVELGAAQERLEQEAWLPDFLYQEDSFIVTTESFDIATMLERYIRLHDRAEGLFSVTTDGTEYPKLHRYDSQVQLKQLFPGALGSGGMIQGYWMVDTLVRVRPYPSVAIPATLFAGFYQREELLPLAGNSNLWTEKAGDYILGNAGKLVAESLRDQTAMQVFQGLEATGKARLLRKSFGDEQADQEYAMGDKD